MQEKLAATGFEKHLDAVVERIKERSAEYLCARLLPGADALP